MKKGFTTLFIAIAAIALGISLSMKPWRVYAKQQAETEQQLHDMKRVEQQHVLDLEQKTQIDSFGGREELARKQGFRKQNEVPAGN
jgi:uncharacterized protein YpmB